MPKDKKVVLDGIDEDGGMHFSVSKKSDESQEELTDADVTSAEEEVSLAEQLDKAPLPAPGVVVHSEPCFTDRDLSVLGLWDEMGRMSTAIREMSRSGNMVRLDHAATELSHMWYLLNRRKVKTDKDLIFQNPSDQFQSGMENLLAASDDYLKEAVGVTVVLEPGLIYPCRECKAKRGVPDKASGDLNTMFLLAQALDHEEMVCPDCGFINAAREKGQYGWTETDFEPDSKLTDSDVIGDLCDRMDRLEHHVKALEDSMPAMVKTAIGKELDRGVEPPNEKEIAESIARNTARDLDESIVLEAQNRIEAGVPHFPDKGDTYDKERLIKQFVEMVDKKRNMVDWVDCIGTDTLGFVVDELRRLWALAMSIPNPDTGEIPINIAGRCKDMDAFLELKSKLQCAPGEAYQLSDLVTFVFDGKRWLLYDGIDIYRR